MIGDQDRVDNPIAERLGRAIEELQKNVKQVEIWAGALTAYTKPVAGYAMEDHRLRSAATVTANPLRSMAEKTDLSR